MAYFATAYKPDKGEFPIKTHWADISLKKLYMMWRPAIYSIYVALSGSLEWHRVKLAYLRLLSGSTLFVYVRMFPQASG